MSTYVQPSKSAMARFAVDYFVTFARLLDPNLPSAGSTKPLDGSVWSLGQSAAFGTLCVLGVAGLLGVIFAYCV